MFMACNGLGIDPVRLAISYVSSLFGGTWNSEFDTRRTIFTHQARNAIALLCQILEIGPGDEVLVPAYNCGAEIDPYVANGADVTMYRISDELRIDVEDIMLRVSPSTRIVHITHFFGWPQEIGCLARWCESRGIILVEDCAQALFSDGPKDTIGITGHAAIYSFVKSLPVPDGGALVLNNKQLELRAQLKVPEFCVTLRNTIPLLKKWFMNSFEFWQNNASTRRLVTKSWKKNVKTKMEGLHPAMIQSNYFVPRHMEWAISRITGGFLNSVSRDSVVKKRRRNYLYLLDSLGDIPGIKLVFTSLPQKVSPMSFPFIVDERRKWCERLESMGVLVQGWPGYYPGLNWDDYPEACYLKDNLLTLPVHQYLDIRHMRHIRTCVEVISRRILSYI